MTLLPATSDAHNAHKSHKVPEQAGLLLGGERGVDYCLNIPNSLNLKHFHNNNTNNNNNVLFTWYAQIRRVISTVFPSKLYMIKI